VEVIRYRGRIFSSKEIDEIRGIIASYPDGSRWFISREVCRRWGWRQANGVLRDMVCRGLLLHLHRSGLIQLPPCRKATPYQLAYSKKPEIIEVDQSPTGCALSELRPIEVQQIRGTSLGKLYNSLIHQYHYLGYTRPVGEHLEYLAFSGGRVIACMGWCSAPRHIGSRDRYIGWNKQQSQKNLHQVIINTLYLILPWVRVPHLASHLIGLITRRISEDWRKHYNHDIVWLETLSVDLKGRAIKPPTGYIWAGQRDGERPTIRTSPTEASKTSMDIL